MRTGFTTGAAAAAAARACMSSIASQSRTGAVDVPLPRGGSLRIRVASCEFSHNRARCSVIKDGGDDPDVTHGAEISVECELAGAAGAVEVLGGEGVGTVTKPGLGLEIGAPAINPVPRRMIEGGVREAGARALARSGVRVTVSVANGAEIATKTDNPRLGIVGGISILGTSGIVVPFSTAAFAASVRQGIGVAAAMGEVEVALTTGGRSEEAARGLAGLRDHCYVQMGDFAGYSVRECARAGIRRVRIFGFVGKMAKLAAGAKQTHVKGSKVDTALLARIARECGAGDGAAGEIAAANTARHAGEIAQAHGIAGFFEGIARRAQAEMEGHGVGNVRVSVTLLGFDGGVLAEWPRE